MDAACILLDNDIYCFVTPGSCDIDAIRLQLASVGSAHTIPRTIPRTITPLESLPVKLNGKVDEDALKTILHKQQVMKEELLYSRLAMPPVVQVRELSSAS